MLNSFYQILSDDVLADYHNSRSLGLLPTMAYNQSIKCIDAVHDDCNGKMLTPGIKSLLKSRLAVEKFFDF